MARACAAALAAPDAEVRATLAVFFFLGVVMSLVGLLLSGELPVASLRYQATPDLALYGSIGRGFETPTLNELSYRAGGASGLNFALRPSVNDSVEVGAKARLGGGLLTAALFQTRTRDEIVTDTNSGGRATFQNAGRTRRNGFELAWQHETANHWRTQLAYTWLDARYRDAFCSPSPCAACLKSPSIRCRSNPLSSRRCAPSRPPARRCRRTTPSR